MPTYEYDCTNCSYEFEAEQSIKDDCLRNCPQCKTDNLRRLISNTSFILKGKGWAADNYSSQKP
jgi:putative FmdB family regulatory protein